MNSREKPSSALGSNLLGGFLLILHLKKTFPETAIIIFDNFPLGGAHLHSLPQRLAFTSWSQSGDRVCRLCTNTVLPTQNSGTTMGFGKLLRGWPAHQGPVLWLTLDWDMGDVPKGSEAHGTQLHWVLSRLDSAHHFGLPFAQQMWEGPASVYPCSSPPYLPSKEAELSLVWPGRRTAEW